MRIVAAMVLAAALVACSTGGANPTTSPSVGISQTQAEVAARAALPASGDLISARVGPTAGFSPGLSVVPGDRVVWAITLAGSFPFSCGPAPPPGSSHKACPPPATSATVLVDAQTGAFIATLVPGVGLR